MQSCTELINPLEIAFANLTQVWPAIGAIEELLGLNDATNGDAMSKLVLRSNPMIIEG